MVLKQDEEKRKQETQQTLTYLIEPQQKYDQKHPKQLALNSALVNFIAEDLLLLSMVESTQFKQFVYKLDPKYQIPSRKHLSYVLLQKKYEHIKVTVKETLGKVKTVNLTIDLWSNRQMRSYLGINAHLLTEDWSMESLVLGCNRVRGRHTSDNIMLWYEEIVSEFCVGEKIKHIVTDSASNMKKAFITLPGFQDQSELSDPDDDSEL